MDVPVVDYRTVTGDFQFAGLYEWQQQALQAWKHHNFQGVIEAVTGAGKTRVGIAAIAQALRLGMKVTVLVPTSELQDQWMASLRKDLPNAAVGRLGGNHTSDFRSVDVIVAIVNSASNRSLIEHFRTGLVVADECHRYAAPLFARALDDQYLWRLGLTATYTRHDGQNQVLDEYFGAIVYKIWYDEAQRYGVISEFDIALVGVQLQAHEQLEYAAFSDQISKDTLSLRNYIEDTMLTEHDFMEAVGRLSKLDDGSAASAIAGRFLSNVAKRQSLLAKTPVKNYALAALAPSITAAERALVFGSNRDQAQAATQTLQAVGIPAGHLMSGMTKVDRLGTMHAFRRGELQVLCAPRVLDEGVDVPAADLAIQTSGTRVQRQFIQRLGRVIRKRPFGDRGRFVYLYAFGTIEDPALQEDFLPDVLPFARDYMYFDIEQHLDELIEFLAPQPQVKLAVPEEPPTLAPDLPVTVEITQQPESEEQSPQWNDILEDGELPERLGQIPLTDDSIRDYLRKIGQYPLLSHDEMVELAQQVEAGLYAEHLLTTTFNGTRRQRRDYWRLVAQGQEAFHTMFTSNLRLVVSVVKQVRWGNGEPAFGFLDVIQEGNIGLHRAVQLWDYQRGFQFSTYAFNWIKQAANRGIAVYSRTIRIPVHRVEKLNAIRNAENVLLQQGITPTVKEVALVLDKTPKKIEKAKNAEARMLSLSTEWWVDRVRYELEDLIVDHETLDSGAYVEERLHRQELRSALRQASSTWQKRDRAILYDRWGLGADNIQPKTLDAVGQRHNLTRERVRQIDLQLRDLLAENQWLYAVWVSEPVPHDPSVKSVDRLKTS